jgi:single-strand DNA-binding protein
MADYNKVILMGRLTRDPEMRYTSSGMAVTKIGLAVGRRYFNKSSQQAVEETAFVDCEAWGKQAETLNQYMRKGRPLFVEGRLKFESWESREGQKRSKLVVVVENFQFMDGGGGGEGGGGGGGSDYARSDSAPASSGSGGGGGGPAGAGRGAAPQVQAGNVSDRGGGEDYDFEDIPF